jgi:1,4-alpha-glucan branching enzyme
MDYSFLDRLIRELKAVKPDVLLVAENLPNQGDLNRQGYDGYAQWSDTFHDKLKALLREGKFSGTSNNVAALGDIFYFSKRVFASHTNNVVNYCESHDETSVSYEVSTNPILNNGPAQDRKGRLGLFAVLVALGQPMLYMGQEFNVVRDRNTIHFNWPVSVDEHGFYQWARRLIHLRKRYPGLKLAGDDPARAGQFNWILAPWLAKDQGEGQRVIGWRSRPNQFAHDALVVLMNFENHDVKVNLDFGIPGIWVKLADIDQVNDIPPEGNNSALEATAVRTLDGQLSDFWLPSSSAFIYKWETPL